MNNIKRKVLVIGNGFDLEHGLPTSYDHFLRAIKDPDGFYRAVKQAHESSETSPQDVTIGTHWKEYRSCAKSIDLEEIHKMVDILRNNSWAYYFARCNAEIVGWVDFELEMIPVLRMFNRIIASDNQGAANLNGDFGAVILDNLGIIRIARLWPNYIAGASIHGSYNTMLAVDLKENYKDKQYGVLSKKLIEDLRKELKEFTDSFGIYLSEIVERQAIDKKALFENMEITDVISFNYTHTAWKYDGHSSISFHFVHGSTYNKDSEKMILGVNRGDENAEYRFIEFEKRYQRMCNSTKPDYMKIVEDGDYELMIYGHSLDITDKSILKPLIKGASKTTVYCHTDSNGYSDRNTKLRNLVLMLGYKKAEDMLANDLIELKDHNG